MANDQPDDLEAKIRVLADMLGVEIRPEHLAEVAQNWALIQPHRTCVMTADVDSEPAVAPIFRP